MILDLIKSGKVRLRSTSLKHASKLEIRDLCSALAKGVKREREGLCSSVKRERQSFGFLLKGFLFSI